MQAVVGQLPYRLVKLWPLVSVIASGCLSCGGSCAQVAPAVSKLCHRLLAVVSSCP
jgi:hypothetical protein